MHVTSKKIIHHCLIVDWVECERDGREYNMCVCVCACAYVCVVAMDMHAHNACSIHDRAIVHTDVLCILLLSTYNVIVLCTPRKINPYHVYSPHHEIHPAMPEREYVYVCVCVHVCKDKNRSKNNACIENA